MNCIELTAGWALPVFLIAVLLGWLWRGARHEERHKWTLEEIRDAWADGYEIGYHCAVSGHETPAPNPYAEQVTDRGGPLKGT